MIETQFASEMTQRGCVGDGKNFCGSFNGYPFTAVYVSGKQGKRTDFMISVTLGGNVKQNQLFKAVKAKTKGIVKVYNGNKNASSATTGYLVGGVVGAAIASSAETASVGGCVMSAVIKNDAEFASGFDALLNAIVQSAVELGYGIPDVCPVCKGMGCDSYAYYENAYRPVHDACVRGKAVEEHAKLDENQRTGSYALGAIGALLGALVGMIVPIICQVYIGMFAGLACMLIPICSYYGYKLLKGKRTKAATAIVILFSILVIPVMDYLMELLMYGPEWTVSVYIASIPYYLDIYLADWGMELFFVIVGIAVSWGIISRDAKGAAQQASFSVNTLRPIGGAAPVAAPAAPAAPMAAPASPVAAGAEGISAPSAAAAQAEKDLEG